MASLSSPDSRGGTTPHPAPIIPAPVPLSLFTLSLLGTETEIQQDGEMRVTSQTEHRLCQRRAAALWCSGLFQGQRERQLTQMGKIGDPGPGSRKEARWSPGSGGNLAALVAFFLQSLFKPAHRASRREGRNPGGACQQLRWKNTPLRGFKARLV